ncbi:hypothetical protein [Allonocardiopsis opalescens]|uniref:Uncharacterized protein n=1 Tax=Allonocardiopsis opalescens TaxID=1144618 RepID=A0A2T0QDH7_9ACTN|nr:hypothetical protein [Allonocardiopsis opalescens]PRY01987.1 hypothetical protein CLV72_101585 [Allonocardiopsis opalescens]
MDTPSEPQPDLEEPSTIPDEPAEPGVEVAEGDAAEQRREVRDDSDDHPRRTDSLEVDEGDAVEQSRAVGEDEDDYR